MIFTLRNVLDEAGLARLREMMGAAEFVPGTETAGGLAQEAKDNLQIGREDPAREPLAEIVMNALRRSHAFYITTYPRRVLPPLFSRYEPGMTYGDHVDNSLMGKTNRMRTDVAVTLFLSDLQSYDGGELVLSTSGAEQAIKLPAGDLVAYPANTVHRVEPVTRGVREAAVTWVQSMVRDETRRTVLRDLDMTANQLKAKHPEDTDEVNRILNSFHSLVRMWVDT